jgi:hypothetical protein
VILEQARQQNLYRVEYAEAALASSYKDIDGIYRTPYGDLRVTIQAGRFDRRSYYNDDYHRRV